MRRKLSAFFSLFLLLCLLPILALAKTGTVTASSLNMRKSASTDAKVVAVLKEGAKVTIKDTSGSWYKVTASGKTGYVYKKYIKVGRKFWHYDGERTRWRKLTVTYIRSGVMFFTFDDEPDVERAWFMGSTNVLSLHAAEIHPHEISEILRERYPDNDFEEICEQCKWDDCDGEITVEVIWD